MSDFHCEVVKITDVRKHPNADSLSIAYVQGQTPIIYKTGEYNEGDLAVYIPVDAIVPDTEEWKFLGEHRRIKAKRLRGVFSMGLITKIRPGMELGQDVQAEMGVVKYEPPEDLVMGGENEADHSHCQVYTDIEGIRRWPDILQEGEEVVLTEKLHGCNSRYVFRDGRLWVGSRTCMKRYNPSNLWWKVADSLGLEARLKTVENIAVYGECFGQVQDLKYAKKGTELALFDALDTRTNRYLDHDDFLALAKQLDLPVVPQLYRGPWSNDLKSLAEGKTTIPGADHVREGYVVKPVIERYDMLLGRVILKLVSEGYLTRKGG